MPDTSAMPNAVDDDNLPPLVIPAWIDSIADWIKTHARGLLALAVVFQLLVLSSMIVLHVVPYVVGERILLHVRPVDPRDVFRGDYVVLSYDFSRTPPGGIAGVPPGLAPQTEFGSYDSWWDDRTVYVSLEPEADGQHYRAAAISVDRPASGLYLKGKFARGWGGNDLHFGIEALYVEEGEGLRLEQLRNANNLSAEIALTPWGQAKLVGVR
jgi:uncharacterized membrane-anchored protein